MPTALFRCLTACALVLVTANAARAELLAQKTLPIALAMSIAQTAFDTCKAQGYRNSIHVVDRSGETILAIRGDGATPHTFENSRRKAYTALTLRVPTSDFAKRLSDPALVTVTQAQMTLPGIVAIGGGLPIRSGDEVVAGIGVSGSPGSERDEACAKAGIEKFADQLK